MAELTEVSNTIAAIAAAALYPNGTGQPSAVTAGCKIYPGWPIKAQLEADLKAGLVNVSVFNLPAGKRTTRYPREWREAQRATPTLVATVTTNDSGATVTVSGTVSTPQNITLATTQTVVSYGVQGTDTLTSIATALAALLTAQDVAATSTGAAVSLPGTFAVEAKVGVAGKMLKELRRDEKHFQLTVWAPTPALRAAAGKVVDVALSGLDFIALPDLTYGRLQFYRDGDSDKEEIALCYRRDIIFAVDYPIVTETDATEITTIELNIDIEKML